MVPLKSNGRGVEAAFALEEGEASTFILRRSGRGMKVHDHPSTR